MGSNGFLLPKYTNSHGPIPINRRMFSRSLFFWATNMLLVNKVAREQLTIIINHLLLTGEFFRVFQKEATISLDE